MHQLPLFFPGAEISVIAKKGIHEVLPYFPPINHKFIFSKEEFRGIGGLIKFGKRIKRSEKFDLFFCLPDSFSAAVIAVATGAEKRIGYKKELRQVLLTHAYMKREGLHRVQEYVQLIELFTGSEAKNIDAALQHQFQKGEHVVVNINSEAASRRLTVEKASELLDLLRSSTGREIFLIGAAKEKEFVGTVLSRLKNSSGIENIAGKTSLCQLAEVLATAKLVLTTDSGPAHLSNALGTHTIVLFGAGKESNTAPYNKDFRNIIRLGELSCEPCEKNICVRYGIPQCLERLNSERIIETAKLHLL